MPFLPFVPEVLGDAVVLQPVVAGPAPLVVRSASQDRLSADDPAPAEPAPPAVVRSAVPPMPTPPLIVAGRVLGSVAEGAAFPFVLLLLVALFLVAQHQLDRRDPKLALAPVYAERDLSFAPPIPGGIA
ncbi:MAG TPA: hypothetical protein VNA14_10690 [Mycobacteriales bacterium]|nr:hypothetical protein [Mycobacteriales bacterium]